MGDSGTQVLAFLISYILIKSHNTTEIFTPEEIFVILSIPGIDMFRLFLFRVFKGKNTFSPDRSHIHHLILEKFNKFQTFVIIQVLILFNIIIFYIVDNKLYTLLFTTFTYLALFFHFIKQGKKLNRLINILMSLIFLLILFPIIIIVSFLIKMTQGPIFFVSKYCISIIKF